MPGKLVVSQIKKQESKEVANDCRLRADTHRRESRTFIARIYELVNWGIGELENR